jgi:hypothetical protein
MADPSDPERKTYRLKPAEFERLNAPIRQSSANDPSASPPATAPANDAPIDVRDLARQAAAGAPLLGGNSPANRPNEVHALLRLNRDKAHAGGLDELAPKPPRKSRRKRDYILALLIGNAVLIVGTLIQPVFGAAGLIIFNVGLTWIVWFVIDDY